MAYFVTLLRYIHQNPVAAGIVQTVDSYTWSSWCEYDDRKVCFLPVCTTQHVLKRLTKSGLIALVNEPLPKTLNILDFNNETEQRISDDRARQYLMEMLDGQSVTALQHFDKPRRNEIISRLKSYGASIRQISRLTGVSEGIVRNIKITQ